MARAETTVIIELINNVYEDTEPVRMDSGSYSNKS